MTAKSYTAASESSRILSFAGALSLLLVVLTGCVRTESALTLSPEDTISGTFTQKFNVQAIAAVAGGFSSMAGQGSSGPSETTTDPIAELRQQLEETVVEANEVLPEDYEFAADLVDDGESLGIVVSFQDIPFDRFGKTLSEEVYLALQDSGEQEPSAGSTTIVPEQPQSESDAEEFPFQLQFTRSGDVQSVSGRILGPEEQNQYAQAFTGQGAEGLAPTTALSVTFPGEVLESNGTVEGSTVTWEVLAGTPLDVNASGYVTGGGFPLNSRMLIWLLPVAVVVGALVLFRRRASASTSPAAQHAPGLTALTPLAPPASYPSSPPVFTPPPPPLLNYPPSPSAADWQRAPSQPSSWLYISDPVWGDNPPPEGVIGAYWVDERGSITDTWEPNPAYRRAFPQQ